jgi:hypothetical protein
MWSDYLPFVTILFPSNDGTHILQVYSDNELLSLSTTWRHEFTYGEAPSSVCGIYCVRVCINRQLHIPRIRRYAFTSRWGAWEWCDSCQVVRIEGIWNADFWEHGTSEVVGPPVSHTGTLHPSTVVLGRLRSKQIAWKIAYWGERRSVRRI